MYTTGREQIQKFLYTQPGMIAVFFHHKNLRKSLTVRSKGGRRATDFLARYIYLWAICHASIVAYG